MSKGCKRKLVENAKSCEEYVAYCEKRWDLPKELVELKWDLNSLDEKSEVDVVDSDEECSIDDESEDEAVVKNIIKKPVISDVELTSQHAIAETFPTLHQPSQKDVLDVSDEESDEESEEPEWDCIECGKHISDVHYAQDDYDGLCEECDERLN